MPSEMSGASPLSDPSEVLQRLHKTRLWTYVASLERTTPEAIIPMIDADSRVRRGEFVAWISAKAVKEGTAIDGHFESLVCTGPMSFRSLRQLAIPSGGIRVTERGHLHLLPPPEAERVWIYLLANDPGVAKSVEAGLAEKADAPPDLTVLLSDPTRMLRGWHREAIQLAVAIVNAHDRPLNSLILFAGFLATAQQRPNITTLAFLLQRLAVARKTEQDVASVLGLDFELPVPGRPLTVSRETVDVLNRFMNAAHSARKETEGTDDIRTRHVAAAFLKTSEIIDHLTSLGVSVPEMRREVFKFILESVPDANETSWRKVLEIEDTPRKAPRRKTPPMPHPTPEPPPREFSIDTIVSRDTWTIDDSLGYGLYAQAITASILNKTTEPPLTIGIQAPWGQGKTSLMRMMQEELDPGAPLRDRLPPPLSDVRTAIRTTYARLLAWSWMKSAPAAPDEGMLKETRDAPSDPRPRIPTIWFNPLYYRETQQVWAGMAHAILQQLGDRFEDPLEREKFWFRLQQSRVNVAAIRRDIHQWVLMRLVPTGFLLLAVALITSVAIALSPASVVWLVRAAGGVAAAGTLARFIIEFARKIDRPFERYVTEPNYQSDLGPLHLMDHDLDRALRLLVGDKPIAVFIDDLDRCDPTTVNHVILAINQFLSLPRRNVFFILGMDMEMVAAALEQAQKDQFGGAVAQRRSFGWRFMEKFVQLPFFIPHLDPDAARTFAEKHLGGTRRNAPPPPEPAVAAEEVKKQVAEASTPTAVGAAMAQADKLPAEQKATLQKEASTKVADLMKTNDSEEMKEIARIAVQDLDLNPRTIVRYFGLVRVLRNIQISTGHVKDPQTDRTIVLRAAHLLMNWPQFVQWLRNEPETLTAGGVWKSTVDQVERLARTSGLKKWQQGMATLMRRETAPPYLIDPSLYRYLRKVASDPPGLKAMYDARMF